MAAVIYLLDQTPFKNYNIYVSDSSNLFDKTNFKESLKKDWSNEHGYDIDLNNRYKEAKTITLNCFIPERTLKDCIVSFNNFLNDIDKKGSRRLSVIADSLRMEYQVFRIESSEMKLTYDDENKVGSFVLKLIENIPVKRILRANNINTTIRINSPKILIINWGDGTQQYTTPGDQAYSKNYSNYESSKYFPIILGDIDSIVSFNTNCTILWNKF